ncbi:MAG: amidohydrolase [Chitinophagales bacterium]
MKENVACDWITANRELLINTSDQIWELAETAMNEHQTAAIFKNILSDHGFTVEANVPGLPTAFRASWGQGKPVIGFLAEYDALPSLSQKAVPYQEPLKTGAGGHACGHNLLGVGSLGAALGLQQDIMENGLPGTVVFLGCPAEEIMIGKVQMAKEGFFDDLDAALTWHPSCVNLVIEQSMMAGNSIKFNFYGRSSHAAAAPDLGRSALDAVELMNIGVNYLREHVPSDVRMHYAITSGGGEPNVVPAFAQVWYYLRAAQREGVERVFRRVAKIAEGAAMMTETRVETEILTECYEPLHNDNLNKVLYECLIETSLPDWNQEEHDFARKLAQSLLPAEYFDANADYLVNGVMPLTGKHDLIPGSTDVANVTWITPTAQIMTCCQALGTPPHTWQAAASGGMSIGHKGMLYAAQVLARAGGKLLRDPELLAKAKEEFKLVISNRNYQPPAQG